MKIFPALLLFAALISGCATGRNQPVCATQDRATPGTTQTVISMQLRARPSEPLLYLISNHYAILFPADSVIELLQAWTMEESHGRHTPVLRDLIKADMPLTDDIDLQKYVIRNTRLESLPLRISAALLETGAASVVDLWQMDNEKNLTQVNVLRLESGGGSWRYFCKSMGEEVLWITDLIVD
jgi:hypothetical protein